MSDFLQCLVRTVQEQSKKVDEAPRVTRSKDLKVGCTRPRITKPPLMIAARARVSTGAELSDARRVPVGWHTGKHLHGEEAIYVESGEGFLVLDDKRYDFFPEPIFHVPYRSHAPAASQHGKSAGGLPIRLRRWHLAKPTPTWASSEQLEECGRERSLRF